MGTQNLTSVWFEGKYRIAQYGQFDGYPSGQGLTVLHFLRNIVNEDNRTRFNKRLKNCRFISNDETIIDEYGYTSKRYDRRTAADILEIVYRWSEDKEIPLIDNQYFGWYKYCDWHYLIDLDNDILKVFNFGLLKGQWDISNLPSDKEFLNTLEYIEEQNV